MKTSSSPSTRAGAAAPPSRIVSVRRPAPAAAVDDGAAAEVEAAAVAEATPDVVVVAPAAVAAGWMEDEVSLAIMAEEAGLVPIEDSRFCISDAVSVQAFFGFFAGGGRSPSPFPSPPSSASRVSPSISVGFGSVVGACASVLMRGVMWKKTQLPPIKPLHQFMSTVLVIVVLLGELVVRFEKAPDPAPQSRG